MGSPEQSPNVTLDDIRGFFDQTAQSFTPLSTEEVAEPLGCSPQTAHRYLEELVEQGELQTKVVDVASRIWWAPEKQLSAGQQPDEERFRAFVSSVKDYAIFMLDPNGVVVSWNEERGGPKIEYQVLLYPSVGVRDDQASVKEHTGIVLSEADLKWFRECYFESEIHERNPYADPTNAGDVSGVAPATVVTAGFDPLRDGGKTYAEQLVRDGVLTRYENYEAMIHGFMTFREIDRAYDAIVDIAGDLTSALAVHDP